jgi:hypothetical protein
VLFSSAALAQYSNLAHLDFLTDTFAVEGERHLGVWIYAEPSPTDPDAYVHRADADEGATCVDDFSRSALVYLWAYGQGVKEEGLELARGQLDFVMAMQAEDGEFYNFVFPDGQINRLGITSRKSAGFWAARALWALAEGYTVFKEHDLEFAARLQASFLRGVPPFVAKVAPQYESYAELQGRQVPAWLPDNGADVTSILMLGLAKYLEVEEDTQVRELLGMLAEGLVAFQYGPPQDYPFLAHLSFTRDPQQWHAWGSRQTQALARASQVASEAPTAWLESAEAEAAHFFTYLLVSRGPVEAMRPAVDPYPQIAFGMESLASGLFALADATGKTVYNELGGLMTSWLLGNNDLRQPMYEPATGRTFDGLEQGIINRNSGAESTITALLALLQAEARPEALAMLDYLWLDKHDETIVEVERGSDFGETPAVEVDARASGQLTAVLEPGASVTIPLELERGGPYRIYALYRAEPWEGQAAVFAGQERLGVVEAGGADEAHFRMTDLGVTEMEAGSHRLTVTHVSGRALRFDALVLRPLVMEKLFGKEGERLLLFKSWGEGETSAVLESLEGEAGVRIYDRFATLVSEETVGATTTITLPPFGFALALWSTAEPLPDLVQAGRQEGPVLELASLFSEGAFVGLDLSPAFNNDAFSDVSDPHKGNFDNHSGVLGATYMAERSPAPGSRFEVEGVPFSFPPTDENANNVAFSNQHLRLPPGQYVRLHLLGASEQGNYQMPVRLHYTDGSSEEVQLGLSDWCQLPRYGETVALEYAQRRTGSGTVDNVACRILAATIDLDDERELAGIDLPDRPTMHIFALTLEKQ